MVKKKELKKVINKNILWDLDMKSLEDVIKYFQNIPLYTKNEQYHRFELSVDSGSYDDAGLQVYGYRWETDKELASRLEREKKAREKQAAQKEIQKEKELKLYEALKKKFEG